MSNLKSQNNSQSTAASSHILQLYNTWNAELDAIGHEVKKLRGEIQGAIDKNEMFNILKNISEQ